MFGTIMRAGFGVLRFNRAEIFRFGLLPQLVVAALTVYVGWLTSREMAEGMGAAQALGVACVAVLAWVFQSLVFSRWARFCLLGSEPVTGWSLVPDAAARRTMSAQLVLFLLLVGVTIPFGLVLGGLIFVLRGAGGPPAFLQFMPLLVGLVALVAGLRLTPYPLARAAGLKKTIGSVWRVMGGSRVWPLLGALIVAGLVQLLLKAVIGGLIGLAVGLGANLSGDTVSPMLVGTVLAAQGVADLVTGLFFYPVFIAMIACAFKAALAARDAPVAEPEPPSQEAEPLP
ncbi:hypothetical protein [Radicibacter daui]|uniref:hypothetical protein n=1 Tax=Radicibacter daui TaxID=3064829 RepID=UPI004046C8D7